MKDPQDKPEEQDFCATMIHDLIKIPRPCFDYGCPLEEKVGEFDHNCAKLTTWFKTREFVEPRSVEVDGSPTFYGTFLVSRLWQLAREIARFEDLAVGNEDRDGETRKFLRTWAEEYGKLREQMSEVWGRFSIIEDDPAWHFELFEDGCERTCLAWEADLAGGTAK